MTEKYFVDTNLLVYIRDEDYPAKREIARAWMDRLWSERSGRTSMQVINELYATLTRKFKRYVDDDGAWDDVRALLAWDPQPVNRELVLLGREIQQRYRINWWDSLIVAAAQLQDCDVLLTEDLQAGMVFDRVTVQNPFCTQVQEPRAAYSATVRLAPRHRPRGRPRKQAARSA